MACFLGCFGSLKKRKTRKRPNKVLPRDQRNGSYEPLRPTVSIKKEDPEIPISPVSELRDKAEEPLSFSSRKKVTFDLNVKTYEDVSAQEVINYSSDVDEEKEREKTGGKTGKGSQPVSLSEDDSITSSMGSYPSNHRYQNCRNSDDEDEIESEESDLDDDDDDGYNYYDGDDDQEESSESFFSSSTESQARVSANSPIEKEVNSQVSLRGSPNRELNTVGLNRNARDRSQYVHSVLNPVENLTQWKAVKARPTPPVNHQKKENFNFEQEPQIPFSSEPTFKSSTLISNKNDNYSKPPKQEITVDASLSNWLVSSETTPTTKTSTIAVGATESSERSRSQRSHSPMSREDQPILGALTIEQLKQQLSVNSSPRRSPSPDEIPILGTVGTYWNHTDQAMYSISSPCFKGIPNTTSKYREDKKVNWHSTPFETRLERALNRDAAEAHSS